MFKGEFLHNIDDKSRFVMPAKMREALGTSFVLTRGLDGCLFAYAQNEWQQLEGKLQQLSFTKADSRAFSRMFFSGAADIEADKQWRVLIPAHLREFAGLEKDIVIIGVGTRVEIWDKAKWERYSTEVATSYEAIAEKLADFDLDLDFEREPQKRET